MSNLFLNIPVPANGPGAAVDTSAMGATKTFIVGSVPSGGTVTLEFANDLAAAIWAPVPNGSFSGNPGRVTIDLAVRWVRANSDNAGGANVDVGASDIVSGTFATIAGTPVDISAMPEFKTVVASGGGNLEISEDGVSWSQVMSFQSRGAQSAVFVGQFARSLSSTMYVGAADLTSDDPDRAPVMNIVYRKDNPGGSIDNVYATWEETYAAVESVRDRGRIMIEFDSRYAVCTIPPGIWNMAGVAWTGPVGFIPNPNPPFGGRPNRIEILDGASFVKQGPEPFSFLQVMEFYGTILQIVFDGKSVANGGTGITPFESIIGHWLLGSATQFINTDPLAAPMFKPGLGLVYFFNPFGISNTFGAQRADGAPISAAPIIDAAGGSVFFETSGGNIEDNALMDSVGGAFFDIQLGSDNAMGGQVGNEGAEDGFAPTYSWPLVDLSADSFVNIKPLVRDRFTMRSGAESQVVLDPPNPPSTFGPPTITPADSPYDAAYNELIICDTTDGNIVINAPRAYPAKGERVVIRNIATGEGAGNVIFTPSGVVGGSGNPYQDYLIGSNTIGPGEAQIYACDGALSWLSLLNPSGSAVASEYAQFFAMMPGDNASTVAIGAAVAFPNDGAANGIARFSATEFTLAAPGTYEVSYQVSTTEAGQLALWINGAADPANTPQSRAGRATGTNQISNTTLVTTTTPNAHLSVRNDASAAALTITPTAGGTGAVSASLVIKRLA